MGCNAALSWQMQAARAMLGDVCRIHSGPYSTRVTVRLVSYWHLWVLHGAAIPTSVGVGL